MTKELKRIAVTGGAGQIAYGLLFRIAAGEIFGKQQPVALHILEVPAAMEALKGVKMELDDCAFPLLKEIKIGSDANEVFGDVDVALLIGAKPRGPGMERKDLISENGKIFVGQGEALNRSASREVRVLVVGNPCNTNCLIAMHNAPDLNPRNFHAMTRLDQNRAQSLLAQRANVDISEVNRVLIWGNHSSTQVPDFVNARIGSQSALEAIGDRSWLESTFIETVQKRGAAIIAARGKSSAASAANAAIDAVRSLFTKTPEGEWFSTAVWSENSPYPIDSNLIFSVPCRSDGDGNYEVIGNVEWDQFLKERIQASEKELQEERSAVETMMAKIRG